MLPSKKCLMLLCLVLSTRAIAAEIADAPSPAAALPPELDEQPAVRAPEGLPALQMSPDFVSPGLAFGGYFPTQQLDSRAVRVEPFTIRAAVNAGLGYDDNVTLTRNNKVSSIFLTVSPGIAVGLEGVSHRYYVVYRGNYGKYFSSSTDNYDDHSLSLIASDDWTTRVRTNATYEYLRGHDPRGATGATVSVRDEWNLHRVRAGVTYGAVGAQGQLAGTIGYLQRDYTNAVANAGRDYEQFDLGGSFAYRIAPKTSAIFEVMHSDIKHNANPLLDSTEMRFLVGATWQALAKTQVRRASDISRATPRTRRRRNFPEGPISWKQPGRR